MNEHHLDHDALPEDGAGQGAPPHYPQAKDRLLVLRESRARILENKALAMQEAAEADAPPPVLPRPPGKWLRRVKRLGWAVGVPLVLAGAGVFLMMRFGDSGLGSLKGFLQSVWLPALLARLLVYAVLAAWLWPIMMQRAREEALARLQALYRDLLAENPIDRYALDTVGEQIRKAQASHISGWVIFGLLLLAEGVLIQLPYWLMS